MLVDRLRLRKWCVSQKVEWQAASISKQSKTLQQWTTQDTTEIQSKLDSINLPHRKSLSSQMFMEKPPCVHNKEREKVQRWCAQENFLLLK